MISFSDIMRQTLLERASFKNLLRGSEPGRVQRGKHDVNARSIRVTTMDEQEAWTFNYKSNPSTTDNRWHGYVRFLKRDVSHKDRLMDLDCMVDCDCPDYRYRFAYNNAQANVGIIGNQRDWKYANQNNGQPPRSRAAGGVGDYGVGLCKHLCSLARFLNTEIDAPEPDDEIPEPRTLKKSPEVTPETPTTTDAPEPEDSYTDSRSGLQENTNPLYERVAKFIKINPLFDVQVVENMNESMEVIKESHQTGEWWIDESGGTTYCDNQVSDMGHEGIVIQALINEILDNFGINDVEPAELSSYEDAIKQELLDDDRLSEEELLVWNNMAGHRDRPADIIIKKLLEDKVFSDIKQATDAVYIAYGSSTRDARDYAMKYWNWKIMKTHGGRIEIQTWHLKPEDLKIIVRGVWDIMDDNNSDDESDPDNMLDDDGYTGPRLNVTVQSVGKRYQNIPLEVLEKGMVSTVNKYRSGVEVGYNENLTEGYHHHHKEYRLYEGNRHIVAIFEDNTRLKFEVHFRNIHGADREKWRRKAFTTWKSVANEIHGDVVLSDACNPIQKSWKEAFKEALKNPKLAPFIRKNNHQKIFDDKGYPAKLQGRPQASIDPINFTPRI